MLDVGRCLLLAFGSELGSGVTWAKEGCEIPSKDGSRTPLWPVTAVQGCGLVLPGTLGFEE